MVLLSLYGVGTGHARLGRSKNSTFQPPSGWLAADEDGERTGDFSKPAALRGLGIAFGLTLTTPSGVRSTPGTTGRSAPLPKLRAWRARPHAQRAPSVRDPARLNRVSTGSRAWDRRATRRLWSRSACAMRLGLSRTSTGTRAL